MNDSLHPIYPAALATFATNKINANIKMIYEVDTSTPVMYAAFATLPTKTPIVNIKQTSNGCLDAHEHSYSATIATDKTYTQINIKQ